MRKLILLVIVIIGIVSKLYAALPDGGASQKAESAHIIMTVQTFKIFHDGKSGYGDTCRLSGNITPVMDGDDYGKKKTALLVNVSTLAINLSCMPGRPVPVPDGPPMISEDKLQQGMRLELWGESIHDPNGEYRFIADYMN